MENIEKEKLSFEQEQDLSSIVDFLEENYTVKIIIPYTKDKLTALLKKNKDPNSSEIMEALNLTYRYKYDRKNDINSTFNYDYYGDENEIIENIHNYDFSFFLSNYSNIDSTNCAEINKIKYSIKSIKKPYGCDLQINQDVIPLRIFDFVNANKAFEHSDSNKKITQFIELPKHRILITYLNVNGDKKGMKKIVRSYKLKVLVGIKN